MGANPSAMSKQEAYSEFGLVAMAEESTTPLINSVEWLMTVSLDNT
jgi:hypothetical protein